MWLSKDEYQAMNERIDKMWQELNQPSDVKERLEKLEGELKEKPAVEPSSWSATIFQYAFGAYEHQTVADRLKRLERQHDQLRKDFDLLTQHLKVRKTTTSEVTRFSPCKKRK